MGTAIYVFAMWNSGITQGLMWRTYNDAGTLQYSFIDSIVAMIPYYVARFVGGAMFLLGTLIGIFNIWMTIREAPEARLARDRPAARRATAASRRSSAMWQRFNDLILKAVAPFRAFFHGVFRTHYRLERYSLGLRRGSSSPAGSAGRSRSRRSSPSTRRWRRCPTCGSTRRSSRPGATSTSARAATPATARWSARSATRSTAGARIRWRWSRSTTTRCSGARSAPVPTSPGWAASIPTPGTSPTSTAPRDVVPESVMPAYRFLIRRAAPIGDMSERLATLRAVGVPYTDAQIENAVADARAQADPDSPGVDGLLERYGEATNVRNFDDLRRRSHRDGCAVAYLQILGQLVDPETVRAATGYGE
jgi:cytochrome c oxidase cbb3-type subunit II